MMGTCVVVAVGEETRTAMAALLESQGMEATLLASLGELRSTLLITPTCGIMLELATSIRASPDDKKSAQDFIELYPAAKFRLVAKQVLIPGKSLADFMDECRRFRPRVLRSEGRRNRYLAVSLSADAAFDDAEAAVTINISEGGCFVYSARQWDVGTRVWLKLPGHDAVARGIVTAWQPWGNNKYVPGIGIKLDQQGLEFWAAACELPDVRDLAADQQ